MTIRERREQQLQAMAERLMSIQMRGCYRQLTAQEQAEYNALLERYRRYSAQMRAYKAL